MSKVRLCVRLLRLSCVAAVAVVAMPALAEFRAGAGKAEIALTQDMLPIDGFTSIHDPLSVRVLLLDDGATRFAIAVLDQTSIGADLVNAWRKIVAERAKLDSDNVWLVSAADFSAPHLFLNRPDAGTARYQKALDAAVESAADAALASLGPARIGFGSGVSDVNVNRNVEMADGWWLGSNEAGISDKQLQVLKAERPTGEGIGLLINYGVPSSVMDQTGGENGSKAVSADLGGYAARRVEALAGGNAVAIYATGPSGDQAPDYTAVRHVYDAQGRFEKQDIGAGGFALAQLQGERLGEAAVAASKKVSPAGELPTISFRQGIVSLYSKGRPPALKDLKPTRSFDFSKTGKIDAPYFLVRIGNGVLIGTQVQLDAATGMEIKRRSPFRHTMVFNMVNGGAKYLASSAGYKAITYQAMNSSFAPGGAEILTNAILKDLKRLKTAAR